MNKRQGIFNLIKKLFLGQKELWKAFWVGGFVIFLLQIPGIYAVKLELPLIWWLVYIPLITAGQIWWIVSVWGCSNNTDRLLWKYLARLIVVYVAVNLVVGFIMMFF
ncbi:hypothetical protein [Desulfonatronovibrio magnus]|uniref:hypothetical protein n=1 Tax=Desulfonatronovibrio magnus TaxID=698827 RepID=UPI0005EB79FB|nr:hypothetical protein [Desulfonatronovibrio magnus]RQD60694.1 MAG: hypothetical protein D5R98_06800 [Desulfonatronovibrio sp. MSAO_Bac4]